MDNLCTSINNVNTTSQAFCFFVIIIDEGNFDRYAVTSHQKML
jgi:hypothetical protein